MNAVDQGKFNHPADYGDVGLIALVMQTAINGIASAITKIGSESGVDVSSQLSEVERAVSMLEVEIERLTGLGKP